MNQEVKIYKDIEYECHYIGTYLCVQWNLELKIKIKMINKEAYKKDTYIRQGDPYISFTWIHDEDGSTIRANDSSIEGGIDINQVNQIIKELKWAKRYIENKEYE